MNRLFAIATALVLGATTLATAASAEIIGVYLRNGEEFILVRTDVEMLYCTRVGDGFEMCGGMVQQADGSWAGPKMKHPDMPKFMTYTGTVTFSTSGMTLEGCTAGNAQCDAESWLKLK